MTYRVSRTAGYVLRLAVGVLILTLLVTRCDWAILPTVCTGLHWGWCGAAAVLLSCYFAIGWCALSLLWKSRLTGAAWWRHLARYSAIQGLAAFTPGRAGELALLGLIEPSVAAKSEVLAALLIQRVTSLTVAVLLAAVAAGAPLPSQIQYLMVALTLSLVLSAGLYLWYVPRRSPAPCVSGRQKLRWGDVLAHATSLVRDRPRALLGHIVVSAFRLLLHALAGFCIIRALGLKLPLVPWIGIAASMFVAGQIPITIWGLGVAEGVIAVGLRRYGIGLESALGVSVVSRTLVLPVVAGWLVAAWLAKSASTTPAVKESMEGNPTMNQTCHF